MSVLGAILAGGQARRFGSDKALAILDGATLIDRVAASLSGQVDAVVLCGRTGGIADRPAGIGPLGGIAAAIHEARDRGCAGVVTLPCDTPVLPHDLVGLLTVFGGAAVVDAIPVIGYWPATLADSIDAHIADPGDHSIRRWSRAIGAEAVTLPISIANINTRADLDALAVTISD